jgi:hypothetical protein
MQIRTNQGIHLIPNVGVTLNFDMGLHEDTTEPRILIAANRVSFVVRTEIAENPGALGVRGSNLRPAVQESIGLIKVCGLNDVRGNKRVVLAALSDAVHLNREEHGNPGFLQLIRQVHGLRRAPTMPVNDDAGAFLFLSGKVPVPVSVQ